MKTVILWIAIMPVLAGEIAIPAKGAAQETVFIVSRAATAEARALLSARLLNMNAAMLHWYEGGGVVRVQIPPASLDTLRLDRDVVLVLPETGSELPGSNPLETPAHPPAPIACNLPPMPGNMQPGAPPMMPMGGGVGMSPMGSMPTGGGGLMAGMGMGLVDSLAGGVAQRLLNRPPSCKISVSKNAVKYGPAGGEGVIEINASGSCVWQAQTSVPWIKILSGSGVSGAGIVSYSVDSADGKDRSGAIWISTTPNGSPIKGKASQVVTQAK